MVKNIIALILSFMFIIFIASDRVSALRDKESYEYACYETENSFLKIWVITENIFKLPINTISLILSFFI